MALLPSLKSSLKKKDFRRPATNPARLSPLVMGRLQQALWTAHAETLVKQFRAEIEEGVEGKIKGGVHTYGLTHCLHIVLGMHFGKHGVHPFSTKLLNHIGNKCAHLNTSLNQPFAASI